MSAARPLDRFEQKKDIGTVIHVSPSLPKVGYETSVVEQEGQPHRLVYVATEQQPPQAFLGRRLQLAREYALEETGEC